MPTQSLLLCLLVFSAGQTALAQFGGQGQGSQGSGRPDRDQMRQMMIERFDADGDGKLSPQEQATLRASRYQRGPGQNPQMQQPMLDPRQVFASIDADGDGLLNQTEFTQFFVQMQQMRGELPPSMNPQQGGENGRNFGPTQRGRRYGRNRNQRPQRPQQPEQAEQAVVESAETDQAPPADPDPSATGTPGS